MQDRKELKQTFDVASTSNGRIILYETIIN